jgi:DNA-binding MarR family transcriptional regulator
MAEDRLTADEMMKRMCENWPQPNLSAAQTVLLLYRARDLIFAHTRAVMHRYDLSPVEFSTLSSLRKIGTPHALTPSDLCQANLVTSGGLTKEDRRRRTVKLTEKGQVLIEEAMAAILESDEAVFARVFDTTGRASLDRLLSLLVRHLENAGQP